LTTVDLESYLRRFQIAEGRGYKAETIAVYGKRIRYAMDAQRHYIDTGDLPTFKTGGVKSQNGGTAQKAKRSNATKADVKQPDPPAGELIEFPFPLRTGQMARVPPAIAGSASEGRRSCERVPAVASARGAEADPGANPARRT
jgi:hypothetical protein